jgi:type II secretory pathway pseudopilin PulG
MSRNLRREGGFTMIELLLVCSLSLIIFGATVTAWTSIYRSNRTVENQNDNAETARVALDRAARQLRNLANPTVNAITTIYRATDYDFVFQTSDPAKTWVRYCLGASGTGGATLYESENKSSISDTMIDSCPEAAGVWDRQTAVTSGVTNQVGGIDRNIFTYECSVNAAATCPASAAEYSKITNVGMNLWVDSNVKDRVSELNVSTGVFLRNQNEAPTAVVSAPNKVGPLRWFLNGSGSSDPEGRTLEYFWFEGTPPTATQIASTPCTQEFAGTAWRGVTYTKKFDPAEAGQARTFYLLVRDPGCLTSLSNAIPITVDIP